jgi:hypothetical protein
MTDHQFIPEPGASFWDFIRCMFGFHAWAEPKEENIKVNQTLLLEGFDRKHVTVNVGCTRLECEERHVYDTVMDVPHPNSP